MLKRACLYIRVSTDRQEELSPDAQKRLLLDYAKSHEMLVSNEYIFIENGISGRTVKKRPVFQRMIGLAKQKPRPFDVILVWKFSRFARNREDSIVYKSMLRKQCGIDVVSITESIGDDKMSVLIEALLEAMDEYYSINLSEEVFRGMTEKALRGGYQTSAPFGYHNGPKGLVIDESEAAIVTELFKRYAYEHASCFDLSKWLNSIGLKTRRGNGFQSRSVEYILKNPTYIGTVRWNVVDTKTKTTKPESEWISVQGNYKPIISKELWDDVQMRFNQEHKPKKARPISTQKHWLSGILKCSACGRSLSVCQYWNNSHTELKTAFQCWGYTHTLCQESHWISEDKIVSALSASLQEIIGTGTVSYETRTVTKSHDAETALLQQQLEQLTAKEKRIKEAYRNGIDTLDEYKENKLLILKEREYLENSLSALTQPEKSDTTDAAVMQRITTLYDLINTPDVSSDEKAHAVRSVIEKIVYDKKNENINIYYYA